MFTTKFQKYNTNCKFGSRLKSSKVSVISSSSNDIFFNLATEEYIFNHVNIDKQVLYLWQNSPTVIIGKHQNPWSECHLTKMEEDQVTLARRYSGGGAVYQDLGNSCFTFMSSQNSFSTDRNMEILINALKNSFGIFAEKSGRNDMVVGEKKISGSAYKRSNDRALHHGTMLLNVNMEAMEKYLHPSKEKLKSKSISSVRSRVMNLFEISATINHKTLCDAIIKDFCKTYDEDVSDVEIMDSIELKKTKGFQLYYEKLCDWDWRFGKTPEWDCQYQHRFDWGEVIVHILSKQGIIQDIKIFSDNLIPQMVDSLMLNLKGIVLSTEEIKKACEIAKLKVSEEAHAHIDQFCAWLGHAI
jgi:lipoate-protein ligase A